MRMHTTRSLGPHHVCIICGAWPYHVHLRCVYTYEVPTSPPICASYIAKRNTEHTLGVYTHHMRLHCGVVPAFLRIIATTCVYLMFHSRGTMQTILVHNQKGGVGKTTTVAALAALWGGAGARILVVDADQQAHATISLGVPRDAVDATASTFGVLADPKGKPERAIRAALRPASIPGVVVLAGHAEMAALDLALAAVQLGRELRLKQALTAVARDFDVALLDLGAARNLAWANAVVAADWLLVPTQLEAGAVDGTVQLVQGARELAPMIGREIGLLGIVPTRVPVVGRTRESRALEAALREHFGKAVTAVVHESPRAASALGAGADLVSYAPDSRAAADYAAIATRLAERLTLPIPSQAITPPTAAVPSSAE